MSADLTPAGAAAVRLALNAPAIKAQIGRLEAALDRVRAIHSPKPGLPGLRSCSECHLHWPCPTTLATERQPEDA